MVFTFFFGFYLLIYPVIAGSDPDTVNTRNIANVVYVIWNKKKHILYKSR